jgi:hypothetical protein
MMRVRPLHPAFGLEITDIRLDTESPSALIAELRRQLARSEALAARAGYLHRTATPACREPIGGEPLCQKYFGHSH